MSSWDQYFIDLAEQVSKKSKDSSTKVGAVIVGPDNEIRSTGFNGFARGVWESQEAYNEFLHRKYGKSLNYPEILAQAEVREQIDARWERPAKYQWMCHSERNAIDNAAREGIRTKGCRIYVYGFKSPCVECAKSIIQAGIVEVIGDGKAVTANPAHWEEQFKFVTKMFSEANVKLRTV